MGVAPMAARFVAGQLEPSLREVVARTGAAADPGDEYWAGFRACPICKVAPAARCVSQSGRVVDGRPDGACTPLPRAHSSRPPRVGRRRRR